MHTRTNTLTHTNTLNQSSLERKPLVQSPDHRLLTVIPSPPRPTSVNKPAQNTLPRTCSPVPVNHMPIEVVTTGTGIVHKYVRE